MSRIATDFADSGCNCLESSSKTCVDLCKSWLKKCPSEICGNMRNLRIHLGMAEHDRVEKFVADARKNIIEISPYDADAKSKSGEAVIIDVRDKDDWIDGHIP